MAPGMPWRERSASTGAVCSADIAIPEEAWTEWLEAQRQRLEGLALDAMVKLGEQES